MKELLIGMGIGFTIGAIMCKTNKPFAEAVEKGVDKTREIVSDIKDEVESAGKKAQNKQQNQ